MAEDAIDDRDVLAAALNWQAQGGAALATVISTWGSSPRTVGAHMAVDANGRFAGSVSGGCVEGAVILEARDVLAGGPARLLEFGVSDETAWSVGLACGGRLAVALTRPPAQVLAALLDAMGHGSAAALAFSVPEGTHAVIGQGDVTGDLALDPAAREGAMAMATADRSDWAADGVFVRAYGRPWRLILVGAVHIAQALAPMARAAGFAVTVVDPRSAFTDPNRFAGTHIVAGWPEEVLPALQVGPRTALVTLAHDPKIDDEALTVALANGCFHVGALGSRRSHAARLERLGNAGVPEADLIRIAGPVGLDIGARTPAEIAVSILAQVIARKRGASADIRASAS